MSTYAGDPAVVRLAGRQHGVVTAGQLAAAGLSRAAVAHRVAKGWLLRMHRGVYLVGPLRAPHSRAMAAVLAYGDGTVLSHYPAAVLWDLQPARPGEMHVTVPRPGGHSRPGIRVHRTHLYPRDITRRHGIPVTSTARTLLDLATQVPQRDLDRATEQAQVHHLASIHSLDEQFGRYPRHRGTAALRKAIQTDPKLTRSEAERRLIELIRAARLLTPESNVRIEGHEVDLVWRQERLVVEIDGYAFHSTRSAFERDRRRDRELQAAGYRVLRLTWRELDDQREAVVAELSAALSRSRG